MTAGMPDSLFARLYGPRGWILLGLAALLLFAIFPILSLGVLNKFLEGMAGAVLAKIMVLVFIVIFIQRKPSGLFAMKGRSAEA